MRWLFRCPRRFERLGDGGWQEARGGRVGVGWFPLKHLVRWAARKHGFIDPAAILARLSGFGQPAEIEQPIELLRAGVVLHARGLINARVIQHNLDWVWPWWVERQFDPRSCSFIPRAFSITHVNLTHRNWTALGIPGVDVFPVIDPRGLVTPHFDGWSLDTWIIGPGLTELIPSREAACRQSLAAGDDLVVITELDRDGVTIRSEARVQHFEQQLQVVLDIEATVPPGGYLVVSLRPYNPEGVSFIDSIEVTESGKRWNVNGESSFTCEPSPSLVRLSRYSNGDVYRHLVGLASEEGDTVSPVDEAIECSVGLASGAALFAGNGGCTRVQVSIPVETRRTPGAVSGRAPTPPISWREALTGRAHFALGDQRLDAITQAAVQTLVLLSPADIYPGPFTYRRFWFRDAGLMINGLLSAGIVDPVERCIDRFELRQDSDGYLRSQEGEWDSNGIALWAIQQFCIVTNRIPHDRWIPLIQRAAAWIIEKRRTTLGEGRHSGLLPAGFSAEHLGPNDFYLWDDWWGIAGLDAAAFLLDRVGHPAAAADYRAESRAFRGDLFRALGEACRELGRRAFPASPYRRLDAGAIGSIACAYPLRMMPIDDPALRATVEYLLTDCSVDDAFFQDMIHSGINPYLSLQLAQILRRMNDGRAQSIFDRIAALATVTGNWPEAIHPATGGGCMGDGQHGWAAAEWVAYVRSMFVTEESGTLVLCSGIILEHVQAGRALRAENVRTPFGTVAVEVTPQGTAVEVRWRAEWYERSPRMVIRFLGGSGVDVEGRTGRYRFTPDARAIVPRRDVA